MEETGDLTAASREELLAIIGAQRQAIAALQRQVGQLSQQLAEVTARLKGSGKGFPGLKPQQADPPARRPRKPRPHGFARRKAEPTQRVEHVVETCPDCGIRLRGGAVKRRREVLEIPSAPVEVIEHAYVERRCPLCRQRWTPRAELGGVVAGRQRLGVNLVSLLTVLREEARLPFERIQRLLAQCYQLHLSLGALVGAVQRVATAGATALAGIQQELRRSGRVQADETGWRETGRNGSIWTFSTPRLCYFLRRSRRKEVVPEVLGDSFEGVLVSDFYAAYTTYPGVHQYCWAHLLREGQEVTERWPEDAALQTWAEAVHSLYQDAVAQAADLTAPGATEAARVEAPLACERRLLRLCHPFLASEAAPQPVLCQRLFRHIKELFTFVGLPDVPPDNNAAERSLRSLVTARKISGGTRSARGSETKTTLASLFGTWRLQGLPSWTQCRLLLSL